MGSSRVIGWIGAGRMGVPMAGFILKAGYPVLVYSRSAAGRDQLVAQGARAAATIAACAREADVIFSSIPDDDALRDIGTIDELFDRAEPNGPAIEVRERLLLLVAETGRLAGSGKDNGKGGHAILP